MTPRWATEPEEDRSLVAAGARLFVKALAIAVGGGCLALLGLGALLRAVQP